MMPASSSWASAPFTGAPASWESWLSSNTAPRVAAKLRHPEVESRSPQSSGEQLVEPRGQYLAGSGGQGAPGQLLQEERDPGPALGDQPALGRLEIGIRRHRGHQCGCLFGGQRPELDVQSLPGPFRPAPVDDW